jgi:hypothetical protein
MRCFEADSTEEVGLLRIARAFEAVEVETAHQHPWEAQPFFAVALEVVAQLQQPVTDFVFLVAAVESQMEI